MRALVRRRSLKKFGVYQSLLGCVGACATDRSCLLLVIYPAARGSGGPCFARRHPHLFTFSTDAFLTYRFAFEKKVAEGKTVAIDAAIWIVEATTQAHLRAHFDAKSAVLKVRPSVRAT